MANLLSIAELAWNQLFPNGGDDAKIRVEEFIASAKSEYAYQVWLKMKAEKAEGEFEVPSWMLTTAQLDVVDDVMDISSLKILRGLDSSELWLQNIGGIGCKCRYIKSTVNRAQLLCGDDSLPDDARTYIPIDKTIEFPRGVHTSPLTIIYINNGEKADDRIEIDDVLAGLVRRGLTELYGGKTEKEDKTTNASSDT